MTPDYEISYTESGIAYIEPKMVLCPSGEFLMGSPEDEEYREDDEVQHHVVIQEPFWFGQYHVTFREYDLFCKANNRPLPDDAGWGRGYRPVINVSWYDAMDYCQWLSEVTGEEYSLPTEEQWEYAVRAGHQTMYPYPALNDESRLGELAWYWENSNNQTHPVGEKEPNNWGIYDPVGLVWVWTSDFYMPYDED
jgi:formylglycine-generating enzyme required for sulfatase activity